MLDLEGFLMLRDLFNEGLSISEIARKTGHSRGTVRKYLVSEVSAYTPKAIEEPQQIGRLQNTSSADFMIILSLPSAFIARFKREDLPAKYTIVKDFVREIRPKAGVSAIY